MRFTRPYALFPILIPIIIPVYFQSSVLCFMYSISNSTNQTHMLIIEWNTNYDHTHIQPALFYFVSITLFPLRAVLYFTNSSNTNYPLLYFIVNPQTNHYFISCPITTRHYSISLARHNPTNYFISLTSTLINYSISGP